MSVLLRGSNGNELELGFIRDSLPDVQDGTGDAAWTTVSFRAATADQSWEEASPCLNLFEFHTLAEWLDAVAREPGGSPDISEVELLEPELKFTASQHTKDAVTIRVSFQLENRPEEMQVDAQTEEAEYIDLHVLRPNIRSAASTLRQELQELEQDNLKDDLTGDNDPGLLGIPDEDLNLVDDISDTPPGAGAGEDNAGNR